jgi:hypothetical protein
VADATIVRFPRFKPSAHVIEKVSICSATRSTGLIERLIFCGEVGVKLLLMLKIVHDGAVNLSKRQAGEVGLYLLWRLATSARGHDIAEQNTAPANKEIALGRTYEQIGIHQLPHCRTVLFLDQLLV